MSGGDRAEVSDDPPKDFADICQEARWQSLHGGLGTLALLLSIACPVLIVYCFNRDGPYYTAHHADAEVVNIWDPWRQPEPWHEDGLLRCTWLDETNQTWDAVNSTATTLTNRKCPALNITGFTEGSLTAMRTTALHVYPVAVAARPVVLGCAFAGVLKESWLYLLQAAVGMCSTFALAVLFEFARPELKGGDDASGWVVVCALPSVVWLAVRFEFFFCWAQVSNSPRALGWQRFCLLRYIGGLSACLMVGFGIFGSAFRVAGFPGDWLYLMFLFPQLVGVSFLAGPSLSIPIMTVLLEFAVWTIFYYGYYDSDFGSFVMNSSLFFPLPAVRVMLPVTMPLLLLRSLAHRHQPIPLYEDAPPGSMYFYCHGVPAYDLPEEASDTESCPETTDEAAPQCDATDGVQLHLRLPNGVLVPVELGSDATLGVLRLRAADALEVDRKQVQVRLALCGRIVDGCNATPLCDVPGLEAGATVDVHTQPARCEVSSNPCHYMELACQGDDVQAARRVLATCRVLPAEGSRCVRETYSSVLSTLILNYARYGCRGVVCCALLEGNLASAAVVVKLLLQTEEESALRVIQESGVLDRPDFYDAFHELLYRDPELTEVNRAQEYVELAVMCPGFLESTACDHLFIVRQVLESHSTFNGDYTALWRQLHEAGWRSTPSAVQLVGEAQRFFFQINLLTVMLLADGVRVRDLPHVVRALCCVSLRLLLYACLAGVAIGVHATLGTQGADPTGGWLFVAFLCIASVTIGVELLPEWVRWLVVLKVCGTRTSQPPAGTQDVELVEELTEMEMPHLNQSSQADTDEALAVGTLLPVRPLPSGA